MSRRLRLFPLNAVLFPGAVLNLHVFEPRYKQLISECLESGEGFGVTLISDGAEAGDPNVVPHMVGSIAEIVDVQSLPFGRYFISTIGRERFRILEILDRDPYLTVEAELIEDVYDDDFEAVELSEMVRDLFAQYQEMLLEFSGEPAHVEIPGDALGASYLIGDTLQVAQPVKQRLLELDDTKARLRAELDFLERSLPQLRMLVKRRREELARRKSIPEDTTYRTNQEKYYGKAFSLN